MGRHDMMYRCLRPQIGHHRLQIIVGQSLHFHERQKGPAVVAYAKAQRTM